MNRATLAALIEAAIQEDDTTALAITEATPEDERRELVQALEWLIHKLEEGE